MEDWQDILSTNKWSTWLNKDVSTLAILRTALTEVVNDSLTNETVQTQDRSSCAGARTTPGNTLSANPVLIEPAGNSEQSLVDVPLHVSKRVKNSEPQLLSGPVIAPPCRSRRSSSIFGALISTDFMVGHLHPIYCTCVTLVHHVDIINELRFRWKQNIDIQSVNKHKYTFLQ